MVTMVVSLSGPAAVLTQRPPKKERGFYATYESDASFSTPRLAAGEAGREAPALQRPEEPPQPSPFHAFHHALHLLELLEQPVDVLDLHPGAPRNAPPARAVDDGGIAPLARCHGVDDGDLPPQLPIALVGRDRPLLRDRPGELVQQRSDAAHPLQLLELTPQVAHVEAFALDDLLREALRLGVIDLGVHLLDQADHIPHPENARGHALGIEGLERVDLLSDADQHDRLAGNLAHRERRAPAGIAIGLGENDAGEVEGIAERARSVHRVLS